MSKLGAALWARFKHPKDVLKALGLDEKLLDDAVKEKARLAFDARRARDELSAHEINMRSSGGEYDYRHARKHGWATEDDEGENVNIEEALAEDVEQVLADRRRMSRDRKKRQAADQRFRAMF